MLFSNKKFLNLPLLILIVINFLLISQFLILNNGSVLANSNSKKEQVHMPLEERVQKLMQLSLKKPLIRLNPDKFRTFIGSKTNGQPIRNYTFVVMMTALSPGRQCTVCRSAADEFSIVANSWRYSNQQFQSSPLLFFGYVDYDEGSEIFQQLKINSAPVFLLFNERQIKSNSLSMKNAEQMDIQRIGFGAETIARWIQEKTSIQIRIIRPPNYAVSFLMIVMFSLFSIVIYVRRNNLDFLGNKTSWSITALAIVFAMTSGQMWSHIRGPPLMHRSAQGISYIHNGSGGQFIIETYIIFVIYVAIAGGFILIINSVRPQNNINGTNGSNINSDGSTTTTIINTKQQIDQKKKKIFLVIGTVLVTLFFSFLMSIFRSKAHGYPYSLLFK